MEFISTTTNNISTVNVHMSSHVRDLAKGQDYTITGHSMLGTEYFDYAVLLDGHGTNIFIDKMKQQDWKTIMSAEDPWSALLPILESIHIHKCHRTAQSSGSTLLMMRAFAGRIETLSVGDSQIAIFKNGEFIYGTTRHNTKNEAELMRVISHPHYSYTEKQRSPIPEIRSSKSLIAIKSIYNYFKDGTKLAMTQALGHNGITGYAPERRTILFEETDTMNVIMGSDGLWEMILLDEFMDKSIPFTEEEMIDILQDKHDLLTMDAVDLVEKVEARWKKHDWTFHWNLKDFTQTITAGFDGEYDDVSVVVWKKVVV